MYSTYLGGTLNDEGAGIGVTSGGRDTFFVKLIDQLTVDAGPDQVLVAGAGNIAIANVSATVSRDTPPDVFTWREGAVVLATGASASFPLGIGCCVTVTVSDASLMTATDSLSIYVAAPMGAMERQIATGATGATGPSGTRQDQWHVWTSRCHHFDRGQRARRCDWPGGLMDHAGNRRRSGCERSPQGR